MKTTIRAHNHAVEIDLPSLVGTPGQIRRAEDARLNALRSVLDRLAPDASPAVMANTIAQVQCLATHGSVGDWIACDQDGAGKGMAALAKRLGPVFVAAQQVGRG